MSLKSGLSSETTWALDTLTILLFDDHTIPWFSLLHLPGLTEVLLEHFRHTLIQLFPGHFEDLEVQTTRQKRSTKRFKRDHKVISSPFSKIKDSEDVLLDSEDDDIMDFEPQDSENLKNMPGNYTMKTRKGSTVDFDGEDREKEYVGDNKKWDLYSGFHSDMKHWQDGRGDLSNHILMPFQNDHSLQFSKRQFFGNEYVKHIKSNQGVTKSSIDKTVNSVSSEDNKENSHADNGSSKHSTAAGDTKCEGATENVRDSGINLSCSSSTAVNHSDAQIKQEIKEETQKLSSSSCPNSTDNKDNTENSKCSVRDTNSNSSGCSTNNCLSPPVLSSQVEIKKENEDLPSLERKDTVPVEQLVKQESACVKTEGDVKPAIKCEAQVKNEKPDPELLREEVCQISAEEVRIMEAMKRTWEDADEEAEAYQRDSASLCMVTDVQEDLSKRCVCLSNIFRSLSFVPGNDREMSAHHGLMLTLGRLLLLHHRHPKRKREQRKFDREEPDVPVEDTIEDGSDEWWWDTLNALRENTLVILANVAGKMKMIDYPEEISQTILDGLLHWAVCPSSQAQDPLPTMSQNSVLSPRRLVIEAMCKLSIKENNVDLILATPPFTRTVQLLSILVEMLANKKEQVMREFAIVLLSALAAGDSSAARAVALQPPTISLLIDFLETAEHQAMTVANSHGVDMLRENPEMMGTSLDMLRRAAVLLLHLAKVPENRPLFLQQEQRLLQLVMSHILDSHIAGIISNILFHCTDRVSEES